MAVSRIACLAAVLVAGCVEHTTAAFTPTSARSAAPRSTDCELEALTTVPSRAYEELGTFDVQPGAERIDTLGKLRDFVRADACMAGADAIIAPVEGARYTRAIAIRWVSPPPATGTVAPE
ncbi:MAG: hypothetical protein K8W52_11615 [Deltaproteobacteria bacterium]|nr:hypothetical protein [Deltaproteobacteria bacterium]